MHWTKIDKLWADRAADPKKVTSGGDITYTVENWEVPGEAPLPVRICKRAGFDLHKFATVREAPRTSVVLHLTAGYGDFYGLMGSGQASVHFMLGREGTPYLIVPTEYTAWHATWWNDNSVGIEIDNIGPLHLQGENLKSAYGDVYCAKSDKDVYVEKTYKGMKYWASMPEAQYIGLARLLKAICFKHQIPRILLPEPQRYSAFKREDRAGFRGICTHVNSLPENRADIGDYMDWKKLISYAGLQEADCFHPPAAVMDTWKAGTGGKVQTDPDAPAPAGGGAAPAGGGGAAAPAAGGGGGGGAAQPAVTKPTATPTPPKAADPNVLPPPVQVDKNTLKVHVGKHGGRICFSVQQPGDPLPTTPDAGEAPAAKAPGKRDEFIAACMNFLGAHYKAGSKKIEDGVDGTLMIATAMRRVELFKKDDEMPADHEHLSALWHVIGGDVKAPPKELLPGDLAWFGKGDHDTDPLQNPFVYLGGGRLLGPVPDGGADNGAVQIIQAEKVPEHFAGWMHVDDFGTDTKHTEHPGEPPKPGEKITGALLPAIVPARYDALKAVVTRAGGKWEDAKGKINLVGVKSMHDRCLISPKPDDWNDTLFAAFLDEGGNKCVLDMRAALDPGTDTVKVESWQLWEGSYKFKLVDGDSVQGKALQADGKAKGWFDKTGMGSPRPLDPEKPAEPKDVKPAQVQPKDDTPKKDDPKPKKDPAPPAATDNAFVFDAAGKKLSIKFGLRMMRKLMEWELRKEGSQVVGTVYSTNGKVTPYQPLVKGLTSAEWPIQTGMQIDAAKKVTVGGQEYSQWHAFGIQWTSTGATNCCNSQFAAIFGCLPDGKMRIKKSDGLLELDVVGDMPKAPGIKNHPPDGKHAVSYGAVFSNAWIQGGGCAYHTEDGKNVVKNSAKTSCAYAMEWLGVGESLGNWGDDKVLNKIRLGDSGQWFSHNWLVGDVRYEVKLKGRASVYVDQSDFVRGEHPLPQAQNTKGGYLLTKQDCEWAEANEQQFMDRVDAFLALKSIDVEGTARDVTAIQAVEVRVFSANCVCWQDSATAAGKIFKQGADGKWAFDSDHTKGAQMVLGISRPWGAFAAQITKQWGKSWGFARWYDNAGGQDFKPSAAPADPTLNQGPPEDLGPPKVDDDDKLPPPIEYKGGNDITNDAGVTFKDHPGTIVFVKQQFEPDPEAWEECVCPPHTHFAPTVCADLNGNAKGYKHLSPVQVFGPDKPFKVVDKFMWGQTGGAVFAALADGTTIGFGHMGEINHAVYKAAKSGEELPAGTWLGSCKSTIGVTTGPHCHMQGWDRPENVLKPVHGLKRDVFLPKLKKKG